MVKIDKLIFPTDFVFLDMEEYQDAPLIFARSFLTSGKTLIDVHKGELTLRVGQETVILNIYHAMRGSNEVSTWKRIDLIDSCLSIDYARSKDPLDRCLVNPVGAVYDHDSKLKKKILAFESLLREKENEIPKKELSEETLEDTSKYTPELKVLPGHLCYAFLGFNIPDNCFFIS